MCVLTRSEGFLQHRRGPLLRHGVLPGRLLLLLVVVLPQPPGLPHEVLHEVRREEGEDVEEELALRLPRGRPLVGHVPPEGGDAAGVGPDVPDAELLPRGYAQAGLLVQLDGELLAPGDLLHEGERAPGDAGQVRLPIDGHQPVEVGLVPIRWSCMSRRLYGTYLIRFCTVCCSSSVMRCMFIFGVFNSIMRLKVYN